MLDESSCRARTNLWSELNVMRDSIPPHPGPESFRKQPPLPDEDVHFVPPVIEEAHLANGVRILLVERRDMPIVATQIVFERGLDVQATPGLASLTASMLLTGTQSRSALQLSDELEAIGARYGAWADHDGMGVSGQALSPRFSELFSILTDMVRHPSFAETELARERARRLSTLAAQRDVPDILLENAIEAILYPPGHPFHAPMLGTIPAINALHADDFTAFHRLAFRPAHATVAIAGDIDKATAIALVEKNLGDWTGEAVPRHEVPEPRVWRPGEPRIVLIDRPKSSQSNLSVATVGIARSDPDYDEVAIMNTVLGGQFSSRLNMNLREKHAFTYGASSMFATRRLPGPFTAIADVSTPVTAPAIREMFFEMERLRHELVTDTELHHAKTNVIRKLPARFETASGTAQALGSLALLGLPLDAFAARQRGASQVTAEDIRRVARLHLRAEEMRVFLVGDASIVREDLEKLNLGAIEVRSSITTEAMK